MKSRIGVYKLDFVNQEEVLIGYFKDHAFIGQSFDADIIVNQPKVSGIHALLERKDNLYYITDLGSHYGTFKKNKRIKESPLKEQEPFQIGKQFLCLKSIEDKNVIKQFRASQKNNISPELNEDFESDVVSTATTANKILQVKLFWGEKTLEVRTFKENSVITLGTQREATFIVAFGKSDQLHLPFPIAQFKDGLLHLNLPVDASGIIWKANQVDSIDSLRHKDATTHDFGTIEVQLSVDDKALIHFGELGLCFSFITPAKPIPVNWFSELDSSIVKITLSILTLLLFLFLYIQLTPRPPEPIKTLADIPQNLKRILFDSGIKTAIRKERAAIGQISQNLEGGRESGDEGRSAGSTNQNNESNKLKQTAGFSKKEKTIGVSKNIGQRSSNKTGLDIDSVFATNTKNSDTKDVNLPIQGTGHSGNVVSKLVGNNYGKGTKGTGASGGGGSVGLGQLKGNSVGGGMGHGDSGLIPSKGLEINSNSSGNGGNDILVVGGLDSDIIAAIIKRYLPQIQNCYEQQLVISPTLRGKVTVAFTIGPDGSVKNQSIAESSLRNQPTEKCILERIHEWKFPRPRGGGTVGVKYPFLLMSNRAR